MILKELELKNFRNYENLNLSFSPNINIFYGENAEGKTNILESIYVLAITKSHRVGIDKHLIKDGLQATKIMGKVEQKNELKKLEILINTKGKSAKINNIIIKKISNYISNFNVIMFNPSDLDLIKGNPSYRRKFLNIEIAQIDNKYLFELNEYNLLVKTRNEYIKNKKYEDLDLDYLSIINEQISKKGAIIYQKRSLFVQKLNKKAQKIYKTIFKEGELILEYKTNIDIEEFKDLSNIKENFYKKLSSNIKRDLFLGMTINGPHRDDIIFYINKKDVRLHASQGQQRIIIVCLKLAEIEIFKEETGDYPVLLLDDIFSELDENKKNNIIKYIKKDVQTFITTTDLNNIDKKVLNGAKTFNIKSKKIKENNRIDI